MPVRLVLDDFDALGVVSDVVVALRDVAFRHEHDAVATIDAPADWHMVTITARAGGHVVLAVRYDRLTASRLHNVAGALESRGWQLDEDAGGATKRFPPGTEAADVAFEVLAVVPIAGAPTEPRGITARDADGQPIPLD